MKKLTQFKFINSLISGVKNNLNHIKTVKIHTREVKITPFKKTNLNTTIAKRFCDKNNKNSKNNKDKDNKDDKKEEKPNNDKENKDNKEDKDKKDDKDKDKDKEKKTDKPKKSTEEILKEFHQKYYKDVPFDKFEATVRSVPNFLFGAFLIVLYFLAKSKSKKEDDITNFEFFTLVEKEEITSINIIPDKITTNFSTVSFKTKSKPNEIMTTIISDTSGFLTYLANIQSRVGKKPEQMIQVTYTNNESRGDSETLLYIGVGFLLYAAYIAKRRGKGLNNFSSGKGGKDKDSSSGSSFDIFNRSNIDVKDYSQAENVVDIKFNQVAGMDSAKKEIMEFVDFLKNPSKYTNLGAKIPRGALLVGPPGTGKTLLAKATAGESGVPFFAMSGSDFVEMFVGVGASRVRQLFTKAKKNSPCIIFIDEIDAIGKSRSALGRNDEKDNTLNQLLVEMDGFGTDNNVVVFAATNFPQSLDSALTRPGRFDRKIEIMLPDIKEREEIFKIYLKKIVYDTEKTVEDYARRLSTLTPGFSGADIRNLVNEAAIISARENKESVSSLAFEKAAERVIAGMETKRPMDDSTKKTIAIHESGHAVVSWMLENASPLVKVTIIPRSKGALGYNQFMSDDRSLHSKEYILDHVCTLLGGRIAEKELIGPITTGASDDLQKVTGMVYNMITKLGMSDLGLLSYSDGGYTKPFSNDYEQVSYLMLNIKY